MVSFDNLSHEWALEFVERRVADRRILRLIRKWLKAGVSEGGQWSETKIGAPQGSVAFTFLGFTHSCGKRRSNGSFIVWRQTANKRMAAKLHAIKAELRRRMHEPSSQVGERLQKVVRGRLQYHAIPGNSRRLWRRVLFQRSQKGRKSWQRLSPLFDRCIPEPRVLHPYPEQRFAATHPR